MNSLLLPVFELGVEDKLQVTLPRNRETPDAAVIVSQPTAENDKNGVAATAMAIAEIFFSSGIEQVTKRSDSIPHLIISLSFMCAPLYSN
jgi:hypothetical protein